MVRVESFHHLFVQRGTDPAVLAGWMDFDVDIEPLRVGIPGGVAIRCKTDHASIFDCDPALVYGSRVAGSVRFGPGLRAARRFWPGNMQAVMNIHQGCVFIL